MSTTRVKTPDLKEFFEKVVNGCVVKEVTEFLLAALKEEIKSPLPSVRKVDSLIYELGNLACAFHANKIKEAGEAVSKGLEAGWKEEAPEWEVIRLLMQIGDRSRGRGEFLRIGSRVKDNLVQKAYNIIVLRIIPQISDKLQLCDGLKIEDSSPGHKFKSDPIISPLVEWLGEKDNQSGHPKGTENINIFLTQLSNCLVWKNDSLFRFPWFGPMIIQVAVNFGVRVEKTEEKFLNDLAQAFMVHLSLVEAKKLAKNVASVGFTEMLPYLAEEMWGDGSKDGGDILKMAKDDLNNPKNFEFVATSVFMKVFVRGTGYEAAQLWYLFCVLWEKKIELAKAS